VLTATCVAGAPLNRWAQGWRFVPGALLRQLSRLRAFLYVARLECRSLLGHMRTLVAREYRGIDDGPMGKVLPDGRWIDDERTKARIAGIQALLSRHSWASMVDKEIFLEGFQTAEQFARRTSGIDLGREESRRSVPCP